MQLIRAGPGWEIWNFLRQIALFSQCGGKKILLDIVSTSIKDPLYSKPGF